MSNYIIDSNWRWSMNKILSCYSPYVLFSVVVRRRSLGRNAGMFGHIVTLAGPVQLQVATGTDRDIVEKINDLAVPFQCSINRELPKTAHSGKSA